jgi:hypothetical protein
VSVAALSKNIQAFVGQLSSVFDGVPETLGRFSFTEVVVSAEVTGKGELSLLGTGASVEGKGGIQLKFSVKPK